MSEQSQKILDDVKAGKFGKILAWPARKVDESPRLRAAFMKAVAGVNRRPRLRGAILTGIAAGATIGTITLAAQLICAPVAVGGVIRKHTTLRDEYGLRESCHRKTRALRPALCTVRENAASITAATNDAIIDLNWPALGAADRAANAAWDAMAGP
jgi:hypothetical protein